MAWQVAGYDVIPNQDDEHISPYLRRRLRSHEEAQRERANGKTRQVRGKRTTTSVPRDPAGEASRDEKDDR